MVVPPLVVVVVFPPVFICAFAAVVPAFPVDGFCEVQLPVVGSKFESPVHLVPALLAVFPVCICELVAAVAPVPIVGKPSPVFFCAYACG